MHNILKAKVGSKLYVGICKFDVVGGSFTAPFLLFGNQSIDRYIGIIEVGIDTCIPSPPPDEDDL